jgi:hypothetical protein
MHRLTLLLAAALTTMVVSGCASAHAKSAPDAPALDTPPPPPRVVEPMNPPVVPLAEEPAHQPAPSIPRRPLPPVKPEPGKPDAPPPEPSKPADEPARPPTTLQTTPAGAEGELERTIRAILLRATGDLDRVDYRRLNAEARTQYDAAKRFVTQAQDALGAKNLVFAKTVAEKAAGLAAQLAGK